MFKREKCERTCESENGKLNSHINTNCASPTREGERAYANACARKRQGERRERTRARARAKARARARARARD